MSIFLISTVRRRCPANEPSGYIYVVDVGKSAVLQRCDIVEPLYRELDSNPRGGMRGAKGISVRPDQIALANFSLINRYDTHWSLLGSISHPSCAGIHDILFEGDHLWVAGARADLVAQFNLEGELVDHVYVRQSSPALKELGWKPPLLMDSQHIQQGITDFRHPQNVQKETFDRAHVNSLCRLTDGYMLVSLGFIFNDRYASLLRLKIRLIQWGIWPAFKSLNRALKRSLGIKQKNMDQNLVIKPAHAQSAIVRLSPDGQHKLVYELKNITAPSHSLLALPDGTIVYLNTSEGEVLHIDPQAKQLLSKTLVGRGGFLRGVTILDQQRILLGNRGDLLTLDMQSRVVRGCLTLTSDPNEAIYDIKELPDHFTLPPRSFSTHYAEQSGQRI